MNASSSDELNGITIKNTNKGFIIELQGPLYKHIGDNVSSGKFTKAFYHELKEFIKSIKNLDA